VGDVASQDLGSCRSSGGELDFSLELYDQRHVESVGIRVTCESTTRTPYRSKGILEPAFGQSEARRQGRVAR
jgi:hypothetical protein